MAKPRYSRKSPYSRRSEGDFRVRVGFPFAVGGADQPDRRILVSAMHPPLERNGYNRVADTPSLRMIGISSTVEKMRLRPPRRAPFGGKADSPNDCEIVTNRLSGAATDDSSRSASWQSRSPTPRKRYHAATRPRPPSRRGSGCGRSSGCCNRPSLWAELEEGQRAPGLAVERFGGGGSTTSGDPSIMRARFWNPLPAKPGTSRRR